MEAILRVLLVVEHYRYDLAMNIKLMVKSPPASWGGWDFYLDKRPIGKTHLPNLSFKTTAAEQ